MPNATEVAFLPLLPEVDISQGEGLEVVHRMLSTLKQQKGFQGAVYGTQIENPDVMTLMIGMTQERGLYRRASIADISVG
jgi:hypothetical protein